MLSPRTQTLVALLASDNDGEALNAARKLRAALKAEGMDFHDLAKGVRVEVRRVEVKGEPPPRPGWRGELDKLLALGEEAFREREWEFLLTMKRWHGQPTERQAQWLADLKKRAGV